MGNKQASIARASILNVLGVVPETNEVKTFIACATLAPRIRTVVGKVVWNIAAVNSHDVAFNRNAGVANQRICTEVCTKSPAHAKTRILAVGYCPAWRVIWTISLELLRISA